MPYESQSDKAAMDRALKATERMLSLEARKAQRFKTPTERMNEALRQERERILAENAAEKEAARRKRTQVGPVPGESVEKQLAHIWEILAEIRPDLAGNDIPTRGEPPADPDRAEEDVAASAAAAWPYWIRPTEMYDASGNAFTTFSNAGWTFAACAKGKRYDPVGPGDIKGETSDIYVALIGASLTGSGSPTEDDTDGAHTVDQHYTGCRRFSTGTYPTRPFPYFPLPTGETWNGHTLAGVELGWFKGLPTFPNWWDAEAETPAFTVPPNGYWVRSVVTGIYVEMGSITFTWRFHTYDAEGRMISEGEPVTLKVYGDGIGSVEGNDPSDP